MSASDVKMLPTFCRYLSIGNYQKNAKRLKMQGKLPAKHAHHYCHGLKFLNRAMYKGDKSALHAAVGEFDYVQHHSKPSSPLLPSTSLNKAKALELLGKPQNALREYSKAIKLKPKYPQAYVGLSGFYLKLGMKKEALAAIKAGLKYSKSSKGLIRRLKKLEDDAKTIKKQIPASPANNP